MIVKQESVINILKEKFLLAPYFKMWLKLVYSYFVLLRFKIFSSVLLLLYNIISLECVILCGSRMFYSLYLLRRKTFLTVTTNRYSADTATIFPEPKLAEQNPNTNGKNNVHFRQLNLNYVIILLSSTIFFSNCKYDGCF